MQKETKKVLTLQAATYEKRLFWILCFGCPQICGFSEVSFILFSPEIKPGARRQGTFAFAAPFHWTKGEKNEKHAFTENIIYGGTGTYGSHYFHHGIYTAGIFPDHGSFHYFFDCTQVAVGAIILGPKGGCHLRSGFWNHQLYAVLRYGSLWNHAVQY